MKLTFSVNLFLSVFKYSLSLNYFILCVILNVVKMQFEKWIGCSKNCNAWERQKPKCATEFGLELHTK